MIVPVTPGQPWRQDRCGGCGAYGWIVCSFPGPRLLCASCHEIVVGPLPLEIKAKMEGATL